MQADVLSQSPDVVVIFFGTNDLRVDSERVHVPLEKYQANLKTMIEACRKQQARVVICTLPPINSGKYFERHETDPYDAAGGLSSLIKLYQEAAIRMAAYHEIPLVDLQQLLADDPNWMSGDGVHPSEQGCAIIAKHVADAVAPILDNQPMRNRAKHSAKKVRVDGKKRESDVLVYGATSAGIIAAVQASRMNKSVVLLESSDHIGGLTTGGLGATDIGNKDVIGGLSREFYHRVALHYQNDDAWVHETREEFFENRSKRTRLHEVIGENATMWSFEPHVADAIFRELLEEAGVKVHLQQRLVDVTRSDAKITEVATNDGSRFRAKMFIDASYEGDLMAKANVSYRTGREANSLYDETLNAIRDETPKNQFIGHVDPYVVPGDPSSGLIPLIADGDGGKPGDGDDRIQAYNFQVCALPTYRR